MNLTAVLITGLLAGGVSCAAVQGGLLTGLITRQRATEVAAAEAATGTRPGGSTLEAIRDDLTPVGGFLAGKLVSHTVLGALLGAAGAAVQLSIGARTGIQIVAGLLIISFGLAQLGVPGFRRIVIEPPASWMRFVRGRARSQTAVAPALLGMATILIPCGVTLSVEALALASGSPLQGALIMAVFIAGTSPLFALIGYAARKLATVWSGRLAAATGVAVVAMGLFTLNGGLELAGSPLAASHLGRTLGLTGSATVADAATVTITAGHQNAVITAGPGGYSPENIQLKSGIPTTLTVHSDNAEGCIRSFLIDRTGDERILPVTGDTRIDLGVLQPGQLTYHCGMGMYGGYLTVT